MTDPPRLRVRTSDAAVGRPRGPLRRLVELLLYPVFHALLLIPALRRWRRAPWWNRVRAAVAVAGGASVLWGGRAVVPGAVVVLLALWLAPVPDPDRVRRIAAQLGAAHTLNGGGYVAGSLPVRAGAPLLLFLSPGEVLVTAADQPARVLGRYRVADLAEIAVDGRTYVPRYVSFAKQPPRRDPAADPQAVCRLTLGFGSDVLEVQYQGVFSTHLAEVAARTLHDLRRLAVEGQPLPVLGGA